LNDGADADVCVGEGALLVLWRGHEVGAVDEANAVV